MHHHEQVHASKQKRQRGGHFPKRTPKLAGLPFRSHLQPRFSSSPSVRCARRHRMRKFNVTHQTCEPCTLHVSECVVQAVTQRCSRQVHNNVFFAQKIIQPAIKLTRQVQIHRRKRQRHMPILLNELCAPLNIHIPRDTAYQKTFTSKSFSDLREDIRVLNWITATADHEGNVNSL